MNNKTDLLKKAAELGTEAFKAGKGMAEYKNHFYAPGRMDPAVYKTDAKPIAYKGFLIYQRIKGVCWDIVKDGICVGQYAGLSGAKGVIDEPTEWFNEKMSEAFPQTKKLYVRKIK